MPTTTLPHSKREMEGFLTNHNPLLLVFRVAEGFHAHHNPPSLETQDGGFPLQPQPPLLAMGRGGDGPSCLSPNDCIFFLIKNISTYN